MVLSLVCKLDQDSRHELRLSVKKTSASYEDTKVYLPLQKEKKHCIIDQSEMYRHVVNKIAGFLSKVAYLHEEERTEAAIRKLLIQSSNLKHI